MTRTCLHAVARSRSVRHRPQMTASAGPIGETEQQADAVAFLETPGVLAPGETARRIDTHAAHIFLAGNRAWKLNRAVPYELGRAPCREKVVPDVEIPGVAGE